ncbi:MAG: carbon-nitrogen hydrolase family protein [Deltaproteobacteria bacterium]|nr:carbon-nitrogen hydrolase family protein [Deltaproteobacteria bacterium]
MRAACVQLCSKQDVQANLETAAALVERARELGAELVALPENFAYLGSSDDRLAVAEALPALGQGDGSGPITRWLSALSKLHGIHVVASGLPENGPDAKHTYNTSAYYGPDGTLRAAYRKIHLFDVDLADGSSFKESATVAAGTTPVVAETPFGAMGLAICYDLRFPELFRSMSARGMDFLVLGAAFTLHTGRDHWIALLKARAIENQCYVIAPAQHGRHSDRRVTFGRSAIIDPWGTELAIAPDRDGVIVADLDFNAMKKIRQELPALDHRRL